MTSAGFSGDRLVQRVVFGDGMLERLPVEASRPGVSRVLLIDGLPGKTLDRIAGLLGHRLAGRWDDVRQHVPADLAGRVADEARRVGPESAGPASVPFPGELCTLRKP